MVLGQGVNLGWGNETRAEWEVPGSKEKIRLTQPSTTKVIALESGIDSWIVHGTSKGNRPTAEWDISPFKVLIGSDPLIRVCLWVGWVG